MRKIFLILVVIVIILVIVGISGYFVARNYLTRVGPEYLFMHPTIAKIFNVQASCPTTCLPAGVCGNDGKNYCNQCVAFQRKAGYAYDGACRPIGWSDYKNFGIGFQYPKAWATPQDNINANYQQIVFNIDPLLSPFSVTIQPLLNPQTNLPETLDQMMKRYIANNKNISSVNNISVSGIKGKEIFTNSALNGQPYFFEADFPLDEQSFVSFSGDVTSITKNTFNKIISTFKIDNSTQIKTDSVNGLLIYKNSDIAFEYPAKLNTDYASLSLQIMAFNPLGKVIDKNGCYITQTSSGKTQKPKNITINNVEFCLTTGSDVGAGQAYNSSYYTTLKSGEYYVVAYVVHTSNGCGVYESSPDVNAPGNEKYKACLAFGKNYGTIVTKPIQDSIATFKFINQ